MSARVHEFAGQLRDYATHFAMRDWEYTRLSTIKHIRYEGDWSGANHPLRRFKRMLRQFKPQGDSVSRAIGLGRWWAWRHPMAIARTYLRTESHRPDGVLDDSCIITHWEETGEYLQYVQPSVGALLADLMDAHPDLPEVQAIADEMKRINDRYADRIAAGDVDRNDEGADS